ncbi:MAG: ABC transporter ATP-binding protein [Simkaniaceae bacterium]|nr:ABC transporter ATP-binding protein [Simkaniaceae bacterium]
MLSQQKTIIRNVYNVIFKSKKKDLVKFLLISTPASVTALLEGLTFGLLLCALYVLNGRGMGAFESHPIFKKMGNLLHFRDISSSKLFIIVLLLAIGAQVLKSCVIYFSSLQAAKLNAKISSAIHQNIYEHILSFDFQTVSNYKTGELTNYAQIPSQAIIFLLQAAHKSVILFFILVMLATILFKVSVPLTLFFSCFFCLSGFAYKKLLMTICKYSANCAHQLLKFSNDIVQAISGIKLIHIFGMQKVILKKSHGVMAKMQEFQRGDAQYQSLLTAIVEVFSMIMMGATLALSSFFLVVTQNHSLPLVLTYIAIAYRFTTTSREFLEQFGKIATQAGSVLKFNEILTKEDKGFESELGEKVPEIKKEITFSNISFKYPLKDKKALNNVSIKIPHKKMTAIVGLSGAGKTTLIQLLTRLFHPSSGKILVDGVDLKKYNIKSWRSRIGVVTQNTMIFNDTARENICFGTRATDKEIYDVCKFSGCYEVVKNLPDGLNSALGEHGYKISGGEAQRIAIARALIRNPDLMIFDEATSNLDSHNEQIIQKTIEIYRKDCTFIVIAHRLSTITSADQIVVLDQGKVLEQGTHEELIDHNQKYAHLWDLQSKKKDGLALVSV